MTIQREESRTDLGVIRIHKKVIASIASLAAGEIPGVKRIGGSFTSGIMELMGNKSQAAVKVDIDKHGEVKVEIPLVVKYDFFIPDVAAQAQESIRQALEKMTNLSIKDININVQGIERG